MRVTARPVVDDDRPFLLDLYAATREEEFAALGADPRVVRSLLDHQYLAREAGWVSTAPGADHLVLELGDHRVGHLVLDRRPDGIRIVDIEVEPSQQGRGIGAAVLRGILDEADAVGTPVTLHVVATNPARRLYERLGFVPVSGDAIHLLMERPCSETPVAQPNTAT